MHFSLEESFINAGDLRISPWGTTCWTTLQRKGMQWSDRVPLDQWCGPTGSWQPSRRLSLSFSSYRKREDDEGMILSLGPPFLSHFTWSFSFLNWSLMWAWDQWKERPSEGKERSLRFNQETLVFTFSFIKCGHQAHIKEKEQVSQDWMKRWLAG